MNNDNENEHNHNHNPNRLSIEEKRRIVKRARRVILQYLLEERDKMIEKMIQEEKIQQEKNRQKKLDAIDKLLDKYNDYMALYKNFGDKEYKEKANMVMLKLHMGDFR